MEQVIKEKLISQSIWYLEKSIEIIKDHHKFGISLDFPMLRKQANDIIAIGEDLQCFVESHCE